MTTADHFATTAEALCEAVILEGGQKVGVPFVEHGRDPAVGLDCVGLLLFAARSAGISPEDRAYALVKGSDYWTPMVEVIETFADILEEGAEWQRGDILGFRYGAMKNHLAVYLGGGRMAHAWDAKGLRRSVITPMDPPLKRRVAGVWRIR